MSVSSAEMNKADRNPITIIVDLDINFEFLILLKS